MLIRASEVRSECTMISINSIPTPGGPVSHGSELKLLFGPVPAAVEEEFANTYLDLYLNFIHELNPGRKYLCSVSRSQSAFCLYHLQPASWSKYEPQTRRVLQLKRNNLTMIADGVVSSTIFLKVEF